jgi:hypothetical protein
MDRRSLFRSALVWLGAVGVIGLLPRSAQAAYYYYFQYRFSYYAHRTRRRYRWRYR